MDFYSKTFGKYDYRILTVIPLLIALLLLPAALNMPLGIDFVGGTEVQIVTQRTLTDSQVSGVVYSCVSDASISLNQLDKGSSVLIKTKEDLTKECLDKGLSGIGFTDEEIAKIIPSTFRPELGKILFEQGIQVFIIALALMAIIVFFAFFRSLSILVSGVAGLAVAGVLHILGFSMLISGGAGLLVLLFLNLFMDMAVIPSIAVIAAALLDITIAIGILSIFGIELSLAGVAALLMLIGYSVDTDIMLATRTITRTNKPFSENVNEAFVTGITMTGTTLAAMSSIIVVTSFLEMAAMAQIAYVLVAGLVADLCTTWFMTAGLLRWYTRTKQRGSLKFKFNLFRD